VIARDSGTIRAVLRDVRHRFQFLVERFMMRGPIFRLVFVCWLIVGVSVVFGLAVYPTGQFESPGAAIWWAFLRLSDPGYLGDDEGAYVRTISTIVTVAGYVLFLGALIAIMTQWLNQAFRTLEAGVTPITNKNHFVVLGWNARAANIVLELLESNDRVRQFLRRRGARALHIAVMTENVDEQTHYDLRDRVGAKLRANNVILRSGSPLRVDHLKRVRALDAAAILLPAPDTEKGSGPDTETIKTLLGLASYCQEQGNAVQPLVVAELLDARKSITARRAYPGPLEIIASNRVVSSLLCQNIRHPGLSHVYSALLSHGEGNEIYAREAAQLEGRRFGDLADAFPEAVVLGIVRRDGTTETSMLNPSDDLLLRADDRIVIVAEDIDHTQPPSEFVPKHSHHGEGEPQPPDLAKQRRILVLGWNHHVPDLVGELDSFQVERFEIVVAATVSTEARNRHMDNHEIAPRRVEVKHVELDYTVPGHLKRLEPASFDNIVFVANDWIESEESDARTILGHLLLREIVPDDGTGPQVLVELKEPSNLALFEQGGSEVIIPALALGHIMAQVALRRELRVVFDDLFGPEGSELFFRAAGSYGLVGTEVGFAEIQRAVAKRNETALGLRRARGANGRAELLVNPPRGQRWTLGEHDELVVLANYVC
jgi:hypothetical protein